ncbi:hypothetical protein GCM10018980_25780 [Streptomyces capoamus]|uniref:Uncharacterized protein n=1 Tax=Streptomyces capoamus TaxID=68183 RepID=A0A919C3M1_9ACTN|nr:hypothetical protein [Streptomyces capoamus]GGW19899.1 hypothetical protein GCM10010501_60550 [Streptomyces libani subsp. rufus]GHG46660.1 hypothetical protein GCM10018980_25780 [Streptomyces capoamus]
MHITRDQVAAAVAYAVFVIGLVLVAVASAKGDRPRMADIGAGVALAGLPFVILARVRRQHHMTAEDKEAIRREGYRLGLDHAARGLLNPPPHPSDGTSATPGAATVHRLYAVPQAKDRTADHHGGERKAR